MDGWNYVLIRVRTMGDIGSSWREMSTLSKPLERAIGRLTEAGDDASLEAARQSFLAALHVAKFSPDLSNDDRARVATEMLGDWRQRLAEKAALETAHAPGALGAEAMVPGRNGDGDLRRAAGPGRCSRAFTGSTTT